MPKFIVPRQILDGLSPEDTALIREELGMSPGHEFTIPETSPLVPEESQPTENYLFGHWRLRLARKFIGYTQGRMAYQFGYELLDWQKLEANMQLLGDEERERIEEFVRQKLADQ